jgi:hypothetical protein
VEVRPTNDAPLIVVGACGMVAALAAGSNGRSTSVVMLFAYFKIALPVCIALYWFFSCVLGKDPVGVRRSLG